MRWFKRILPWALGGGIVAALVWAYLPKPVPVELGTALRGPLEVIVAEPGRARVRQRFVVAAPVGGTLQRIALRPGDTVQRGELLARIRPLDPPLLDARNRAQALSQVRVATAAREQAEEQLERARALLGFAQAESMRQVLLARTGNAPQRAAEAAEVEEWARRKEAASAGWALDAATSELESARAAVRRFDGRGGAGSEVEVRAPTSGVILRVPQESEGPIAAGAPMVELGDASELEIAVDLLTPDAVRVAPGAAARIERWGGDGFVAARVRKVEPSGFTRTSALGVEEQRVTVILDAADRIPRLGDGFRVEVAITLFAAADVLQVPASSVFRTDATWSVFVAADGRVQLRPIEIGQRNDSAVEVRTGLDPGERVLLHPSDRVRPGVRYVERAAAATGA